jgi:serine phosphatase RsbU (regulator of sigma subunit)
MKRVFASLRAAFGNGNSQFDKNLRRTQILLRNSVNITLAYALALSAGFIARATGIANISYISMVVLSIFVIGASLVLMLFTWLRKRPVTAAYSFTLSLLQFALWVAMYGVWVVSLNEIRSAGLLFALMALTFMLANLSLMQALVVALSVALEQVGASWYAIHVAGQQGSLSTEIFYSLCFLPGALFMAYLSGEYTRQRTEVKKAKRTSEAALAELRERDLFMEKELDIASDIQRGILPVTPISHNGISIEAFYRSMEKIGGDFFDVVPMSGGHVCVLIADVSGHGIPAAFVSAIGKISFIEATQKNLFPRDILTRVNSALMETIKTQDYLTAFVVGIRPSFEVSYTNASHHKAMVLRARTGEIETWDTNGLFVGAIENAGDTYEEKQDMLDFGDRMLLFTDGLVEARNAGDQQYGIELLQKSFLDSRAMSIKEARAYIIRTWEEFVGATSIRDDVTFLLIEVDPSYQDLINHRNRGLELLYNGSPDEAIGELRMALQMGAADEKVHHLLARCHLQKGEFALAIEQLKLYLGMHSEDADTLYKLSAAYYNVKDYENAAKCAQKACQLRQNFKAPLLVLSRALIRMQKEEEAVPVLEKILSLDPENSTAKAELSRIRGSAG